MYVKLIKNSSVLSGVEVSFYRSYPSSSIMPSQETYIINTRIIGCRIYQTSLVYFPFLVVSSLYIYCFVIRHIFIKMTKHIILHYFLRNRICDAGLDVQNIPFTFALILWYKCIYKRKFTLYCVRGGEEYMASPRIKPRTFCLQGRHSTNWVNWAWNLNRQNCVTIVHILKLLNLLRFFKKCSRYMTAVKIIVKEYYHDINSDRSFLVLYCTCIYRVSCKSIYSKVVYL